MTKSESLAETIRQAILNEQWRSGEKLPSESELCSLYKVSRTVVRNALSRLASEGFLITRQGSGSYVCLSEENYPRQMISYIPQKISRIDMFEFRRMAETESAALAAIRADEANIRQLRNAVESIQYTRDPQKLLECDLQFHKLIAKATKNAVLPLIFDLLEDAYQKMFEKDIAANGDFSYQEHIQIVKNIESRNPEGARHAMAEHLNHSMFAL